MRNTKKMIVDAITAQLTSILDAIPEPEESQHVADGPDNDESVTYEPVVAVGTYMVQKDHRVYMLSQPSPGPLSWRLASEDGKDVMDGSLGDEMPYWASEQARAVNKLTAQLPASLMDDIRKLASGIAGVQGAALVIPGLSGSTY
jgi:hypothetical protein